MTDQTKTPVLLSYAFRPFFLLAALSSIGVVVNWVLALNVGGLPQMTPLWHAREMIVGFALAAVTGFSLTAVSVWTGRPAVHGMPIALLILCWLAMAVPAAIPAPAKNTGRTRGHPRLKHGKGRTRGHPPLEYSRLRTNTGTSTT